MACELPPFLLAASLRHEAIVCLKEEMNHYFTFVIRPRILMGSGSVGSGQVREPPWADCPSTEREHTGEHRNLQVEENYSTRNHSMKNSNS